MLIRLALGGDLNAHVCIIMDSGGFSGIRVWCVDARTDSLIRAASLPLITGIVRYHRSCLRPLVFGEAR
jgi:hypothetical protein